MRTRPHPTLYVLLFPGKRGRDSRPQVPMIRHATTALAARRSACGGSGIAMLRTRQRSERAPRRTSRIAVAAPVWEVGPGLPTGEKFQRAFKEVRVLDGLRFPRQLGGDSGSSAAPARRPDSRRCSRLMSL